MTMVEFLCCAYISYNIHLTHIMHDANRIHNAIFTLTSTNSDRTQHSCHNSLRNTASKWLPNWRASTMSVQTRDSRAATLDRHSSETVTVLRLLEFRKDYVRICCTPLVQSSPHSFCLMSRNNCIKLSRNKLLGLRDMMELKLGIHDIPHN